MSSWATRELQSLDLGDVRRSRRLARMVATLTMHPSMSVPRAFQSKAEMNAAYYSWNSPYVTPQAIRAAHRDATVARLSTLPLVLVPNDTTNLDFTTHESVAGLGYLDGRGRFGLMCHTATALTPEGLMLGILHQECWSRMPEEKGKSKDRAKLPLCEKESQKWVTTLDAVGAAVPETTVAVVVGDRESDVYGVFAHPRDAHVELLVRSAQNRRLSRDTLLWETVEAEASCGTLTVEVGRADGKPARQAQLTLRYKTVKVLAAKNAPGRKSLPGVEVQALLALEEAPPAGTEPLRWFLLTTLAVSSGEDAARVVGYYARRWSIERYHFVLKSGCKVEDLQLESIDALETALATYSIVAWRLLHLTYQARLTPDAPCDLVFEPAEWEALCCRISKKPTPPKKPPTLREAVRMVASLGGFLGRKSDGEPGVKTIWLGLGALHESVEMYTAMRGIAPPRQHPRSCRER